VLLPRGRAAGEVLQPRVEVGDPVFDVQDGTSVTCQCPARLVAMALSSDTESPLSIEIRSPAVVLQRSR
jgi:hypothetical protein